MVFEPEERVGSLLAAATERAGLKESRGGGRSALTSAEIGALLGAYHQRDGERLEEGPYRTVLMRYCAGDASDRRRLVQALAEAAPRQTGFLEQAGLLAFVVVVVDEFIDARRCAGCEGRCTVMAGALVDLCPRCRGSGWEPRTAKDRATRLGIAPTTFRRGPAERLYLELYRRLVEWEDIGLRRVVRRARA